MFRLRPANSNTANAKNLEYLVCLFSRTKILAVDVRRVGEQLLLGKPAEFEWSASSLNKVISEIQATYQAKKVKVLLGQDLAVVKSFVFESGEADILKQAESQVKSMLSTVYDSFGIDYQEIIMPDGRTIVQVFAVKKSFLNIFGSALDVAGMEVETIDPLGVSLARRVVPDQNILLLWGEDYLYSSLIINNELIEAKVIAGEDVYKQIDSLISSMETDYRIKITGIVMASKKLSKSQLESQTKKSVTDHEVNPFVGATEVNDEFSVGEIFEEEVVASSDPELPEEDEAQIEDENISDSGIIQPQVISAPKLPLKIENQTSQTMESVNPPQNRSNTKFIAVIVMMVVVLLGMLVGGFFVYRSAMSEASQPPVVEIEDLQPTPMPEPDPNATSTAQPDTGDDDTAEVDVSSLRVNILNGSGIAGAAGVASDVLEEAGFTQISTGNASSYDFEETVVSVKAGQTQLYQLVLTALQDDYEIVQGDDLPTTSNFDVVVTVGSN